MSLPKHLEEAVGRMKEASARIDEARARPATPENLTEWLSALTDFSAALADVQMFDNESVHEKLHEIAERVRLLGFPPHRPTKA